MQSKFMYVGGFHFAGSSTLASDEKKSGEARHVLPRVLHFRAIAVHKQIRKPQKRLLNCGEDF